MPTLASALTWVSFADTLTCFDCGDTERASSFASKARMSFRILLVRKFDYGENIEAKKKLRVVNPS